jgi:hypothetical protein
MTECPYILTLAASKSWGVSDWKDLLEAISAAATVIGIVVAGGWTYLLFIKNRAKFPWADLSQEIRFKSLTSDKMLVHVTVIAVNTGKVLLPITHVWTRLHQISPVPDAIRDALESGGEPEYDGNSEIKWLEIDCRQITHEVGKAEIEPGESERFEFDFIIDSHIETIAVYSFFKNQAKQGPGWCRTTILDNPERR